MPDLLLELLSEEIPARMQADAAAHLKKAVTDALVAKGCLYEGAPRHRHAAPHRPLRPWPAPASPTSRKSAGPPRRRAEAAIQGFLKSAGLASIDQAVPVRPEEGRQLHRHHREAGPPTADVIAEIGPEVIRAFPGRNRCAGAPASTSTRLAALGAPAPVHPLHLRPRDRGAAVIPFSVDGIVAGDTTAATASWRPRPSAPGGWTTT